MPAGTCRAAWSRPAAVDQVAAVPGVAQAGPLGVATVTVEAAGELTDATLFGHAPDGPGQPATLTDGRRPERPGEAVASSGDEADGFAVGDTVTVRPGGEQIEIVGLARDINFSVTPTLFSWYATFEAVVLSTNPDAPSVVPSAVAVQVEPGSDPAEVAGRITTEVPGTEALDRTRAADEAPGVESVSQSLNLVLLLTYVVATIIIGFFFLILTVQKAGPLTLLRALGVSAGRLVASLAVQVATVVGSGLVIGAGLAVLALSAADTGIGASVEAAPLLFTAVVVTVLAAIACLGSIRRVVGLDPADATVQGGVR